MESLGNENYRLLNAEEVAVILVTSKTEVKRLLQEGKIRFVRIGNLKRVRPEDLEDYIEKYYRGRNE